jgi:hypothetical protein
LPVKYTKKKREIMRGSGLEREIELQGSLEPQSELHTIKLHTINTHKLTYTPLWSWCCTQQLAAVFYRDLSFSGLDASISRRGPPQFRWVVYGVEHADWNRWGLLLSLQTGKQMQPVSTYSLGALGRLPHNLTAFVFACSPLRVFLKLF